jgi:hypothetical protein
VKLLIQQSRMNHATAAQVVLFAAGTKPGFKGWGPKFSPASPGQLRPWFAESCDHDGGLRSVFRRTETHSIAKKLPADWLSEQWKMKLLTTTVWEQSAYSVNVSHVAVHYYQHARSCIFIMSRDHS